jgi:protein-tyrosine phosphatase
LVFHCAAGKDRTGVLAAIVLGLLGVDPDVIAADYSLSGASMPRLRAWFEATVPEARSIMTNQPEAFMQAPVEAMSLFLEGVEARYGSVAAYADGIGVTSGTIAALRESLLMPNS